MNLADKKVAILVHNYFEQAELEEPLKALRQAGADVSIISSDQINLTGLKHLAKGDGFKADLLLDEAASEDYDALVLPGGAFNADQLRVVAKAKDWVAEFMDSGKPLAVICHAPWVLASADVIEGRRLTSFHTIKDDLVNVGADWVNLPLVEDDNLITSRQPTDLPQFNKAIISALNKLPTLAHAN